MVHVVLPGMIPGSQKLTGFPKKVPLPGDDAFIDSMCKNDEKGSHHATRARAWEWLRHSDGLSR